MRTMRQWHSSPTRELPCLEQIEQRQRARADRLYQPMSSPIKRVTQTDQRHKLKAQMQKMRDDLRQERQELSREKTVHDEDVTTRLKLLQEQAEALQIDLDLLLEEEEEMKKEVSREVSGVSDEAVTAQAPAAKCIPSIAYFSELENELEDILAAEESELEARLKDLQL